MENNKFVRNNETNEVYSVRSIKNGIVTIDHCVRDIAWTIPEKEFKADFTTLSVVDTGRAEILSDIIYQLDAKHFKATLGTYVKVRPKNKSKNKEILDFKSNLEVKDIVNDAKYCSVCAIGAMFVSAVSIHNKLKAYQCLDSEASFIKYLSKWFSHYELRLMEEAFEGWYGYGDPTREFIDEILVKYKLKKVNRKHSDIVLREIIANTLVNGKFAPEKGLAP